MFHSMMNEDFYIVKKPNVFKKAAKMFGLKKKFIKLDANKTIACDESKKCEVEELTQAWKLLSLLKPHF